MKKKIKKNVIFSVHNAIVRRFLLPLFSNQTGDKFFVFNISPLFSSSSKQKPPIQRDRQRGPLKVQYGTLPSSPTGNIARHKSQPHGPHLCRNRNVWVEQRVRLSRDPNLGIVSLEFPPQNQPLCGRNGAKNFTTRGESI